MTLYRKHPLASEICTLFHFRLPHVGGDSSGIGQTLVYMNILQTVHWYALHRYKITWSLTSLFIFCITFLRSVKWNECNLLYNKFSSTFVTFEVFTAVKFRCLLGCDAVQFCGRIYQPFEGPCCLHLPGVTNQKITWTPTHSCRFFR